MSRKTKEHQKEIAAFGERQFHDTGAAAVEVLRVKASTMRKHFRKLKGITYLVSVISLDRVRIYFFNSNGIMLLAENIEPALYTKIRKTSRLIIKYEKPQPPTEEELRIEATEELRTEFSKAIRRTSRILGQKEPKLPSIFVSRESLNASTQGFGLFISDDGTMIFEEKSIESNFAEGVNLRAAMLLLLEVEQAQLPFSQFLGNAFGYSLLNEQTKAAWLEAWIANTSEALLQRTLHHFVRHTSTYLEEGYQRFVSLLQEVPPTNQLEKWIEGVEVIHNNIEVPLGTEEHQLIKHFCNILKKPRKLTSTSYKLDSIHLSPRVFCDPTPLGTTLSISKEDDLSNSEGWLSLLYLEGSETKSIILSESGTENITSIDYILNIEDIFPKPAGIVAHGKDFIRWAKRSMNLDIKTENTFEAGIEFSDTKLATNEKAVLERLVEGDFDIILNSLIGSPQRVDSLVRKGKVVFLPNFQHLGVFPNLLIIGGHDSVYFGMKEHSLESTILNSDKAAYAIVCAPVYWELKTLEFALNEGIQVYPIVQVHSTRQIVRCEKILPSDSELERWLESTQ